MANFGEIVFCFGRTGQKIKHKWNGNPKKSNIFLVRFALMGRLGTQSEEQSLGILGTKENRLFQLCIKDEDLAKKFFDDSDCKTLDSIVCVWKPGQGYPAADERQGLKWELSQRQENTNVFKVPPPKRSAPAPTSTPNDPQNRVQKQKAELSKPAELAEKKFIPGLVEKDIKKKKKNKKNTTEPQATNSEDNGSSNTSEENGSWKTVGRKGREKRK